MNTKIRYTHRKNLYYITILLLILLLLINLSITVISNNFKKSEIEEENRELILLTTYLIDENDLNVALEYIHHYSVSHQVEIEIKSNDELLYSSVEGDFDFTSHQIVSNKGVFIINTDNSHSTTTDLLNKKYLYVNISSVVLFIITITSLYIRNKRTSLKIEKDLDNVMHLIENGRSQKINFSFEEFSTIYYYITNYIQELDLLRERRQLNVKGLAHDIKTPLTIINTYLKTNKVNHINYENSLSAIANISSLVEVLMADNYTSTFINVDLDRLIREKVSYYQPIFNSKSIVINYKGVSDVFVKWNEKDLKIVLENMFSNAFYYSLQNTSYKIDFDCIDDEIILKFTSTGNPVLEHNLSQIFEKGYRCDHTTELNPDGKGIGLYIVKLLLRPIDGSIEAVTKENEISFIIKMKKA